jgi:hypothetical protein
VKSKRSCWAGHVVRIEETRNAYRILVMISLGKGAFRRSRIWEGNIKMDYRQTGCEDGI